MAVLTSCRAFIHVRDSVRCIEIAVTNPPPADSRVLIFNQMTECHRVRDLAALVSSLTGVPIGKFIRCGRRHRSSLSCCRRCHRHAPKW